MHFDVFVTTSGSVILRFVSVILLVLAAALSAGWLAMQREDIPYNVLENRYASQDSQFMTLSDGLMVHYVDEGPKDAPAIILFHGLGSSVETWRAWRADFSTDYRVISVDLPGHGLTRSPNLPELPISYLSGFVAEVCGKLDLNDAVLVGSSLGGHAVWHHAVNSDDEIAGLVLIAAAGLPPGDGENAGKPFVYTLAGQGWLRPFIQNLDPEPFIRNGMEGAFSDQTLATDELIDLYSDLSRAPGHREALLKYASRPRDTAQEDEARLLSLDVPVLILQGRDDQIIPSSDAERFANLIPNADLVSYPGIGHLPQEEAVEVSLADMRAFLDDVFPAEEPLQIDDDLAAVEQN